MSDPQWSALADFFKQRFPACPKCQKEHDEGPDTMLLHLTVSHFEQEAIETFGRGLFCSLCGERLPQHEESHKQHCVLNHMAKHFDAIAPKEAQHLLKGPNKTVAGAKLIHESESNVDANITKTISVSENLFEKLEDSEDEKYDIEDLCTEKVSRTDPSDLQNEAKEGISSPILDQTKSKITPKDKSQKVSRGSSTEASFQACQEYFRNKYPTCKTCKKGHEWICNMKRHLVMQHCGEEAIKHFGSGDTCAVCKKFSINASCYKGRSNAIKSHMKAHLNILLTNEKEKYMLKLVSKSYINSRPGLMWKDCQEYFKNIFSSCDICKIGHENYDQLRYHLLTKHYLKQAIESFGTSTTCSICKKVSIDPLGDSPIEKVKKHMKCHLEDFIPDEEARTHLSNLKQFKKAKNISASTVQKPVKKPAPIKDCEMYFSDKFPSCKACEKGHARYASMKQHLTKKHYNDKAMKLFGTGIACQICQKYSTQLNTPWPIPEQIVSHMATHLEDFIPEDEARELLLKAKGLKQY